MIVNGQFVKRDGKATDVMAGLPIRYPVEEKGRFVPASTNQWGPTIQPLGKPIVRPPTG